MTVYELLPCQIDELKESLFYQFQDMDDEQPFSVIDPVLNTFMPELSAADSPSDISNNVIFAVYDGIHFLTDDFFCTAE